MIEYDLSQMKPGEIRSVLDRRGIDLAEAVRTARPIIDDVRARGDVALRKYARSLDGFRAGKLRISGARLRNAGKHVPRDVLRALLVSKNRIECFHRKQLPQQFQFQDECGTFGQRVVPLDRVGIYVPGGSANYASTVLMASIPAIIAGVEEIAICTPGSDGEVPETMLAAADLCGVTEMYAVGGAHAIAAMAYGTSSIPRVQKIIGPGGAIVTAAKLLVRNDCEIDFLAGPSEILIIADAKASPELVALDMLAQLEHDPLAFAVLVTCSRAMAESTRRELKLQLASSERASIASRAAEKGAIFIVTNTIDEAVRFANKFAPEHLLIDVSRPQKLLNRIRNAGSVFLGKNSSVVFGDYCAGTNHILPTMGKAAMKSALSVYDFLKVIPYQNLNLNGVRELSGVVDVLARSEGLPAHARAALARVEGLKR